MINSGTAMDKPDGRSLTHRRARPAGALVAILGLGLMLGACSKCDVPNWFPSKPGQSPQSCHDAPATQ
jgi:hypothetical protein